MAGDLDRLAENPFYLLGLRPGCARADVEREGQKLLGMLELGLSAAAHYQTPMGPRPRTADAVRHAMAELRDPQKRLVHELWARLPPDPAPPPPAPSSADASPSAAAPAPPPPESASRSASASAAGGERGPESASRSASASAAGGKRWPESASSSASASAAGGKRAARSASAGSGDRGDGRPAGWPAALVTFGWKAR